VLTTAIGALARWRGQRAGVTVVAIDGYGASGKSTIAAGLATATNAAVVHLDDFFLSSGRDVPGPAVTVAGSHVGALPVGGRVLGSYYDVARLRAEALEPLLAGQPAVFRGFDWPSGGTAARTARVVPEDLVLLEGVYSAAPELSDVVDRAIFVDTPASERLRRLRGRIAPADWDDVWLRAEEAYFAEERPIRSFDLVIPGTEVRPPVEGLAAAHLEQDLQQP